VEKDVWTDGVVRLQFKLGLVLVDEFSRNVKKRSAELMAFTREERCPGRYTRRRRRRLVAPTGDYDGLGLHPIRKCTRG
jgi:hypothetical protein